MGFDPVQMLAAADGESLNIDSHICYHPQGFTTIEYECQAFFIGEVGKEHLEMVSTRVGVCCERNEHPLVDDFQHEQEAKHVPGLTPDTSSSPIYLDRVSQRNLLSISCVLPIPGDNSEKGDLPKGAFDSDISNAGNGGRDESKVGIDPVTESIWKEDPLAKCPIPTEREVPHESPMLLDLPTRVSTSRLIEYEHTRPPLLEFPGTFQEDDSPSQQQTIPLLLPTHSRPTSRADFDIAVVCALPFEKNAVQAIFDDDWDDGEKALKYGTSRGDTNAYSHGRIGRYNVVVANTGGMGKVHAAVAGAHICHSWPRLKLILVVGICGAVPYPSREVGEIILGDVVISSGVVQYDYGRRLDNGFIPKKGVQDSLPRAGSRISAILGKLQGRIDRMRLRDRLVKNLRRLEADPELQAAYLGAKNDCLFSARYRHIQDGRTCHEAGCNGFPIRRERLKNHQDPTTRPPPAIHIGLIGSADTVMKSGSERDRISEEDGVIAFEMEGAGIWSDTPCLVIKGVCDYADSHKNKDWQPHAAAAAAACAAAFLDVW